MEEKTYPKFDGEPEGQEASLVDAPEGQEATAFSLVEALTEEMAVTKSPEASRALLQRLGQLCSEAAHSRRGKLDHDSLVAAVSEFEQIPNLQELQTEAIAKLEKMGAVNISPEGSIIVDLDQIKILTYEDVAKLGLIHKSSYYGNKQKYPTLFHVFKGRKVISENDYRLGEREGKPLFYSPTSEEEAFDLSKIQQAEFYLGLWDSKGLVYSGRPYPSTEDGTDFTEVSLACLIYHPSYGRGYRDESGRLLIYNWDTKKYSPVSAERLFKGSLGLKREAQTRPAEYAMRYLPNLNRSGLLMPEDFGVKPALGAQRPYYVERKITPNGSVMIDNIQYYLGKVPGLKGAEIYKLSDQIAVVRQAGEVTHTFRLLTSDSPELMVQSSTEKGGVYYRTRKKATQLTPYNRETFLRQAPDETDQAYEQRTLPVENFELWSKLDRVFGASGLNPFRSMELEPGQARDILSLSEKLDSSLVSEIITSYRAVVGSVHDIGVFIRDNLGSKGADEKTINSVIRQLKKKGLDLILRFADNPPSSEEIKSELADLQSEVLFFAATFKAIRSEGQAIELADFPKFKPEVKHGSQISEDERDEMKRMIVKNRLDRPDIIAHAEAEFETALANPDTSFYLLKYAGDLVGFFRIDRQGELDAYLGSLNVPRQIQGSGIGDEMLKTFFTQALMGRVGHASADPRNPITPLYIGRYQFVGSAIKPFGNTDRPFIEMTLNPRLNSQLKYLNAPDQEVVALYGQNEYQIGQPQIVLRFPEAELDLLMHESDTILSSGQYLLSAFRRIATGEEKYYYAVLELNPNLIGEQREVA